MARSPGRPGQEQIVVRMPADLHAALVARSKAEERSMAQTIRYALRRYLSTPLPAAATDPIKGEPRS
jgi:predicted HicB family RNase H-like nuclease